MDALTRAQAGRLKNEAQFLNFYAKLNLAGTHYSLSLSVPASTKARELFFLQCSLHEVVQQYHCLFSLILRLRSTSSSAWLTPMATRHRRHIPSSTQSSFSTSARSIRISSRVGYASSMCIPKCCHVCRPLEVPAAIVVARRCNVGLASALLDRQRSPC